MSEAVEEERLQKFLARAGIASRRAAETMILAGRISVNGQVVRTLGTKVASGRDVVAVDGKDVKLEQERHWYIFYKPVGVITTLSDPQERETISDFTKPLGLRLFPVGRLDYDAEGALLLTDDGEIANKLMHPRHQVERTYLTKVKGVPTPASLQRLLDGVRLEDGPAKAVEASIFNSAEKNTWLKLVVTEGRQHLVKRLCAAVGHPVMRLFRPAHAGISVQKLDPGSLRVLTDDELSIVKSVSSGNAAPAIELFLPARRHGRHGESARDDEEPQARKLMTHRVKARRN